MAFMTERGGARLRDMASFEVSFLQSQLAVARRERETDAQSFQTKHLKNFKRSEAIRKRNVELKNELMLVNSRLSLTTANVEAMKRSMDRLSTEIEEVRVRCSETEEAMSRQPGATLRLEIKRLCSKYHPDKAGESGCVPCADVIRDLVGLLAV